MEINIKNPKSKEGVEFFKLYKDRIVEYNEDSTCLEVENLIGAEIIEYIKTHFKTYKYFILGKEACLLISDSFKLCPTAFCFADRKNLEDSINRIYDLEAYWLYGKGILVRPEGKEWRLIIGQLQSKLANGELTSYEKVEIYLGEKCDLAYSSYDADISVGHDPSSR